MQFDQPVTAFPPSLSSEGVMGAATCHTLTVPVDAGVDRVPFLGALDRAAGCVGMSLSFAVCREGFAQLTITL